MCDLFRYQWLLHVRSLREWVEPMLYLTFMLVVAPFTLENPTASFSLVYPSLCWLGLIFSAAQMVNQQFYRMLRAGLIEQFLSAGVPMLRVFQTELLFTAVRLLPLSLLVLLLGKVFEIHPDILHPLFLGILVSIPALVCVLAFAASLTSAAKHRQTLMVIVTLPLLVPVFILGMLMHESPASLYWLLSLDAFLVTVTPFVIVGTERASL